MQSVELALVQTVATDHAARIVDRSVLEIDGLGFAVLFAHAAVLALAFVETHLEQRKTREETQRGADGADGVAVDSAFPDGQTA